MADESDGVHPTLRRWTFDLADNTNGVREELLDDMYCEFPRTNDGCMTVEYRHGWAVGTSSDRFASFNEIVHYDTRTGARKTFPLGDDCLGGEAVFAPRVGATEEGDGYLLTLAYNEPRNLSELLVFHATDIDRGPIAPRRATAAKFRRASMGVLSATSSGSRVFAVRRAKAAQARRSQDTTKRFPGRTA